MLSSWPHYADDEISAVMHVLSSGNVNSWTGDQTSCFESEFLNWCGSNYAVALANGSLALSASYLSLGLNKGDEVITTPRSFIATASSAVLLGLIPIFADVDKYSGLITAQTIEPLITQRTRAISIVHLAGWPADMPSIMNLAKSYNLKVIEDCAQAHGAYIQVDNKWRSVGSFGDVSAWSFCQDKIISTGGEGGMITTNDNEIHQSIWSLKDHGKTIESVFRQSHPPGFRWLHDNFGSNFRITEMQSAIGRLQLKKLSLWSSIRTRNAKILLDTFKSSTLLQLPKVPAHLCHAWYKFYTFVKTEALADSWSRDRILSEINASGYPALSGTCSEIYLEKCFAPYNLHYKPKCPVAKSLGDSSLMFLIHPTICEDEMYKYADTVSKILLRAQR